MISKTLKQEIIRISVSILFIAGAVYLLRDKWVHAFEILKGIDVGMFAWVCALFLLINVIVSFRLKLVLRIQEIKVPLARVIYFNFVGLFFNLFLPSALGGDIVKAYYISKDSG